MNTIRAGEFYKITVNTSTHLLQAGGTGEAIAPPKYCPAWTVS